jgi:hypothetical protein
MFTLYSFPEFRSEKPLGQPMPVDVHKFFQAAQAYIASETDNAERAYATAYMVYLGDYEGGFLDPALAHLDSVRSENEKHLTLERMYWIRAVLKAIYLRHGGELSEQCAFAENATTHYIYKLSSEAVSEMKSNRELELPYFEQHWDVRERAGTWHIPFNFAKTEHKENDILISHPIDVLIDMHRYETTGPVKDEIRRQILHAIASS